MDCMGQKWPSGHVKLVRGSGQYDPACTQISIAIITLHNVFVAGYEFTAHVAAPHICEASSCN